MELLSQLERLIIDERIQALFSVLNYTQKSVIKHLTDHQLTLLQVLEKYSFERYEPKSVTHWGSISYIVALKKGKTFCYYRACLPRYS